MLQLKKIIKTYAKRGDIIRVLNQVSLTVAPGEFVAVQGPSGSGKTTLLLIAGGLLRPDQGNVLIFNQDFYQQSPEQRALFRAKHIGFVFQQYHLIPYLTVLENVLTPTLVQPSADARHRALGLIEQFGLTHRIEHTPAELSSGEKQRTALARALLQQPQIVLADEITGNLDQDNSKVVLTALNAFAQSGGSALLVTHDVEAANWADRTEFLQNGAFETSDKK